MRRNGCETNWKRVETGLKLIRNDKKRLGNENEMSKYGSETNRKPVDKGLKQVRNE